MTSESPPVNYEAGITFNSSFFHHPHQELMKRHLSIKQEARP